MHRIVQPHIHPGNQSPRQPQFVILDQQDFALEVRQVRHLREPADDVLAGHVGRMRLAGEDEQDRTLFVAEDLAQPVEILEQQRGALVRSKAARETDGEHVRIDRIGVAQKAVEVGLVTAVAEMLARHPVTHQVQHLCFQGLAHAPEQMVRHVVDALPERVVVSMVRPVEAEKLVELVGPLRRQERGDMHAVGDIRKRILVRRYFRPQRRADTRGHAAVNAADAVLETRSADRQRGHVELLVTINPAERKQIFLAHAQFLAQPGEIVAHHVRAEVVMARRYRRVGREHGVGSDRFEGRVESQSLGDQQAHALEHQECRVALVDVPGGRFQSEFHERPHAADAEHDFLFYARGPVAAVKAVSDVAIVAGVFVEVGIEQVQRHMPHLYLPDFHLHGAPREIDLNPYLGAVIAQYRRYWQVFEIGIGVKRVLVALSVDGLVEIALAIEQAHADEGQTNVARRLAMVAGKNAQPPGVDRKTLVESEFGAEVRDQIALSQPLGAVPAHRLAMVGIELGKHAIVIAEEHRVVGSVHQFLLVDPLQESLRVMTDFVPEQGVEAREQQSRLPVPAVTEVVGELLKPGETARQLGVDFEGERRALWHG